MQLVTGISMALLVVLVALTIGCASPVPIQIEPTPNRDATVEAKVAIALTKIPIVPPNAKVNSLESEDFTASDRNGGDKDFASAPTSLKKPKPTLTPIPRPTPTSRPTPTRQPTFTPAPRPTPTPNPHEYFVKGNEYRRLGNWSRAISEYTKVIRVDPGLPDVHFYRAYSHAQLGQHPQAVADYTVAISKNPDGPAYMLRSISHRALGQIRDSNADIARACLFDRKYCPPPTPTPKPTATPRPPILFLLPSIPYSFCGAWIIADDGQTLGKIVSPFYIDSIANEFGSYGSDFYLDSIWNDFGPYGSSFSNLSAFNDFTNTPPKIIDNGAVLGYVTTNTLMYQSVEPYELKRWLEDGNCP